MGYTDPEPDSNLSIAIIGAGIAGLALALGLRRRGLAHVTVYERAANLRETGAGIGFTANAERAMRALDPDIHLAFKRVAVQNADDWFVWVDGMASGAERVDAPVDAADLIHRMYLGARGFEGCARAEFLLELARLLPARLVKFSHALETVEDRRGRRVKLGFRGGRVAEADVVVGCDGISSQVRKLLLGEHHPAVPPGYSHKFALRGLIPMTSAKEVLGPSKTQTRHMYLGKDGHVLTFPVAGGSLLNVVAFMTDEHDWVDREKMMVPTTRTEAVAGFSAFGPTVRAIIDLLPEKISKWAVFDMYNHPLPSFACGRICLSGDAAHATAPYHGAGAGFAIEDAVVLAELLLDASRQMVVSREGRSQMVRKALETYSDTRMKRAQWLVNSSRRMGAIFQWQDEEIANHKEKCAEEIEWRSKEIWNHDIDQMVNEAIMRFRTAPEKNAIVVGS